MKLISEQKAIELANARKGAFAAKIGERFEHRAKSCATCEVKGSCCTDVHFVNVRITRLEARAINAVLSELPEEARTRVTERIRNSAERLENEKRAEAKFACPLFERDLGCLVHGKAKPLPCITHACYERPQDLPPDELLAAEEAQMLRLERRAYGRNFAALPIPLALETYG
ncbi:MAG: hypothetical protein KF831_15810 [Acidobacteria bacterium]|nr:hypothetical protein [Acidobacteriota bacterium]